MDSFWTAVSAVKRDPDLIERHASQIAEIDRLLFEQWKPLIRVEMPVGNTVAIAGTLAGLGLVAAGYYVADPWNGLAILAGTGVLLGTTHGLGHILTGAAVGIRFIAWFVAGVRAPQPGVKTDKASYLRTPPRSRAWMHASGAIVTKLVPFLMLGPALVADVPAWTWVILLIIGFGQFATDAIWSTKTSDWMRYRREMRIADELQGESPRGGA